jgi:DNA-binding CsgD family transcriptional regulator
VIIGRAAELRAIDDFLASVAEGPAALVLQGDAGIGKSALWTHAVRRAAEGGSTVLTCRPVESEAQMAYAGLGDLLADLPAGVLSELPAPQRRALEVALLLREPEQEQSARSVAQGLLGVVTILARQAPVVVAVDDAPWLDQPSASALAFVARRLTTERVGVLLTRRAEPSAQEAALSAAVDELGPVVLSLRGLSTSDLVDLLDARQPGLGRRDLASLQSVTEGNPFFALEIGRAMALEQRRVGPHDVPMPASLRGLVGVRLGRLSAAAREATEVVAACLRPTPAIVTAVLGRAVGDEGLDAAEAAGVVERTEQRLRLTHPLLASVAYADIPPPRRRRLHAVLATVVDDPEERGRHLALATDRPDAAVADALDTAARRARARGAPDASADLWDMARRLTPAADQAAARRRGVEAAERYFDAGDVDRATSLLEQIAADTPPGTDRAGVLNRLGWVTTHRDGFHAGAEVFRAALDQPSPHVAMRIEIEEGLAWCAHSTASLAEAETHAQTALALAEDAGDPELLAGALAHTAFLRSLTGEGIELAGAQRAVRLGCQPAWSQILGRPDWVHALLLEWTGELRRSLASWQTLHRDATDHGDEHSLPHIAFHLARVELLLGDWPAARVHAAECQRTTVLSGQAGEIAYSHLIEALVEAHLGQVESARARIEQGRGLAERYGSQPARFELMAVLGLVEISVGDAAAAEEVLDRVAADTDRAGFREPAPYRFHGDRVEAKVMLGKVPEALALLDELDSLGATLDRPWVHLVAARGRGLAEAASGQLESAHGRLQRALSLCDAVGEPFERARTLLALGSVPRRDRKKAAARASLEAAHEAFTRLGAAVWVARTQAELDRLGGARGDGLTPTEQRVAELIASGLSYRETADALFISPKTVQWNLSKIYRKLGVRSATELAAQMARSGCDSPPSANTSRSAG